MPTHLIVWPEVTWTGLNHRMEEAAIKRGEVAFATNYDGRFYDASIVWDHDTARYDVRLKRWAGRDMRYDVPIYKSYGLAANWDVLLVRDFFLATDARAFLDDLAQRLVSYLTELML